MERLARQTYDKIILHLCMRNARTEAQNLANKEAADKAKAENK